MFGGSGALSVSAGITLVFIFGAILPNWRWVCIGCGIIPVLVISLMPFLPETPNYLVMTGNREEAYKALRCEIFGFFFSRSLKTREKYISFAQFVYFLREVCLLFNF